MRTLKRVVLVLIALSIVLTTILFILENQQPVALVFLGWSAPELSLAVPVVCALLIGMIVGPLLSWLTSLGRKRRASSRIV